ncbi:MAG: hypothetical protein WKF41_06855 [Gaiellaceae bacterium]
MKTAARKQREATLRAVTAEFEAGARENIRLFREGEMTEEVIADLRQRERIANLHVWIDSCSSAIERGRRAEAAKADFEAELERVGTE